MVRMIGTMRSLDIADSSAAQPLSGAFEPPCRDIAGDELAAVFHLRGKRQRFSPRAGAEIDDTHAGTRIGQKGGNLRSLVLHLDQPVLECGCRCQRRAMLEPEAERRPRRRLGLDLFGGEGAAGGVAVGLQRIDAQVERGRRVERRQLVFKAAAIDRREIGFEPVRQIAGDGARHLRMG
jgi:hypothetical protein